MLGAPAVALGLAFISFPLISQTATDGAWEHFNRETATFCPSKSLGSKSAGDVNYLQEQFYSRLSKQEYRSFTSAIPRKDGGPRMCSNVNGISCPTVWNMEALRRAKLLHRFERFACSKLGEPS